MKLSKKILTFVAPIAATMTIAPIITSCNNETFEFKYADSINCLKKFDKGDEFQNVELHSLNKVKEVSKLHAATWTADIVTQTILDAFLTNKQVVYYDIVASLANMTGEKFAFAWKDDGATIKHVDSDSSKSITNAVIKYIEGPAISSYPGKICIQITGNGFTEAWLIESYTFRSTKLVTE